MSIQQPQLTETPHKKLYLIDGYGFIFRAYHIMPPFSNTAGEPVGAVYGFTRMLIKLLEDHKPDYLAVAFDAGKETFRTALYGAYKANRPEPPDDLRSQFKLVRDAVAALGIKAFELAGFEADDIIATFARKCLEQDIELVIISSDKDLMQLVQDEKVVMFDPMKAKWIKEKEVFEKFGVAPAKVLDVSALIGDSSDNVPGVPGIGPKTASELINEYGDLDSLLTRAGEIKQNKRREVMLANIEQAKLSRELIRLHYDVPLVFNFDELAAAKSNEAGLLEFARLHGFKSIISKVSSAQFGAALQNYGSQDAVKVEKPIVETERKIISKIEDLRNWLKPVRDIGKLAVFPVRDCGIALSTGVASCYIKFDASVATDLFAVSSTSRRAIYEVLKPLLENSEVLKIMHGFKENYSADVVAVDDLQIMRYVLGTGLTDGSIYSLAPELPKVEDIVGKGRNKRVLSECSAEDVARYGFPVVEFLFNDSSAARQELFDHKLMTIYEKIEKPLIGIIARIEKRGAKIDGGFLEKMSARFAEKMLVLEAGIYKSAGHEFNIGSPQQLSEVLFGEMGLPGGKKSKKTGNYSTGVQVLDELAEQGFEIAQRILEWRQINKLKSTYTDALPKQIEVHSGRVHTIFGMTTTSTGRISSTEPNLQNIPIRTEEGKVIRNAFIAEKGNKIISADYSQIELRLLAHMADIKPLKEAFKNGLDVHAITAHQMFGVPVDQVSGDQRRMAKTINFGIIYGVSAHGLSWRLKIPREQAAAYIKVYFEQYPGIKEYMRRTIDFCKANGFVETLFGRKLHIRGINDRNHAVRQFSERAAINAPLQGTAADIIKKAMVELDRQGLPMILQVHDELLFEVPEAEAESAAKKVKAVMENVVMLPVPLLVESGFGDNWGEVH